MHRTLRAGFAAVAAHVDPGRRRGRRVVRQPHAQIGHQRRRRRGPPALPRRGRATTRRPTASSDPRRPAACAASRRPSSARADGTRDAAPSSGWCARAPSESEPEPEPAGEDAYIDADGLAVAPASAPAEVQAIIEAGNEIATKPYKYGGGHGRWRDSGYDCSGSISYALHGAGLLDTPLDSTGFMSWGERGKGDVGDDLRQRRPRLHDRRRTALRHERAQALRQPLERNDAVRARLPRPSPGGTLMALVALLALLLGSFAGLLIGRWAAAAAVRRRRSRRPACSPGPEIGAVGALAAAGLLAGVHLHRVVAEQYDAGARARQARSRRSSVTARPSSSEPARAAAAARQDSGGRTSRRSGALACATRVKRATVATPSPRGRRRTRNSTRSIASASRRARRPRSGSGAGARAAQRRAARHVLRRRSVARAGAPPALLAARRAPGPRAGCSARRDRAPGRTARPRPVAYSTYFQR